MNVLPDNARFDELQIHLIEEIVASIRDGLREAGVTNPRVLGEATSNLAFSIAAILDGNQVLTLEGREVIPVLTFARERDGPDLIAPESGGSWMHEYVPALLQAPPGEDEESEFDESIDFGMDEER
jgi:hypothetical protein